MKKQYFQLVLLLLFEKYNFSMLNRSSFKEFKCCKKQHITEAASKFLWDDESDQFEGSLHAIFCTLKPYRHVFQHYHATAMTHVKKFSEVQVECGQ